MSADSIESGLRVGEMKFGRHLCVSGMVCGYGKRQVVSGVSLEVESGEIVALIGHNGSGKSTLLKAIFGLIPIWKGSVTLDGTTRLVPSPADMLRSGVAYLPQGNRVFTE